MIGRTNAGGSVSSGSVGEYKVEFRDIDGELYAPIQYVNSGDSAVLPSVNPHYDSDYLEFVEWRVNNGESLSNVQKDIIALPLYRTKYSETLQQRPSYIIGYFYDTTPLKLQFGLTPTNTYIDWGDSSATELVSSSTITHTYASNGKYVITIYGDNYRLGGNSFYGITDNSINAEHIYKIYYGENAKALSSHYGLRSLKVIVFPTTLTNLPEFRYAAALKAVVLTNTNNTISSYAFYNAYSLKYVVHSNACTFEGYCFGGCNNLEVCPAIRQYGTIGSASLNFTAIKEITIPSTTTGAYLNNAYNIKKLTIPQDFNAVIYIYSYINDNELLSVIKKLKDNTGTSAKTITFALFYKPRLNILSVLNGEYVPYGTAGSISLLQYLTNKNWTVSWGNIN